jgi:hypothetical protein
LTPGVGGFDLNAVKSLGNVLTDLRPASPFDSFNEFRLNLTGASWKDRAEYKEGRVTPSQCYVRGDKVLPIAGAYEIIVDLLQRSNDLSTIIDLLKARIARDSANEGARRAAMTRSIQAFEALINDQWVLGSLNPDKPRLKIRFNDQSVRLNADPCRS